MKKFLIMSFLLLIATSFIYSQGCVIVRNISGFSHYNFKDYAYSTSNWVMDITGRYFRSYMDFKGTKDLRTPKQDRNINKFLTLDYTLTRILRNGWSLSFNLPITSNERSTTAEHGGAGTRR